MSILSLLWIFNHVNQCCLALQCVMNTKLMMESVHSRNDIFTKALPRDAFRHLRRTIIGW